MTSKLTGGVSSSLLPSVSGLADMLENTPSFVTGKIAGRLLFLAVLLEDGVEGAGGPAAAGVFRKRRCDSLLSASSSSKSSPNVSSKSVRCRCAE